MTQIKQIDPFEAKELLDQKKALIVDVREESEYQEERISGSIHLPLSTLKIKDFKELPLSEHQTLIIQCRSGMRSAKVCVLLQENDFDTHVFNLAGGILAWQQAGLGVIKG
jgi:rhodanese-related sulfurtransferase